MSAHVITAIACPSTVSISLPLSCGYSNTSAGQSSGKDREEHCDVVMM